MYQKIQTSRMEVACFVNGEGLHDAFGEHIGGVERAEDMITYPIENQFEKISG